MRSLASSPTTSPSPNRTCKKRARNRPRQHCPLGTTARNTTPPVGANPVMSYHRRHQVETLRRVRSAPGTMTRRRRQIRMRTKSGSRLTDCLNLIPVSLAPADTHRKSPPTSRLVSPSRGQSTNRRRRKRRLCRSLVLMWSLVLMRTRTRSDWK